MAKYDYKCKKCNKEIEDQMLEAFKTLKITDKHIDYNQLYDIMY